MGQLVKRSPVPVTASVTATVGPVHLRLFPATRREADYMDLPWAWCAVCMVKFQIGELVTSKRVRTRIAFWGSNPSGPQQERPSDSSLAAGRQEVLAALRDLLVRHGFEPPELEIIEAPEPTVDELECPF